MANTVRFKTTYNALHLIEPIYTNGGLDLSHDGRILATCVEGDVVLTDLRSGQELARINGDGEVVTSLALAPSGSRLVVCSRSLAMRVYTLSQSDESESSLRTAWAWTTKAHEAPVICTAIDGTSTLLATGGADGIVKVWDLKRNFMTHTFHGHSGLISALAFFQIAPNDPIEGPKAKRLSRKGLETGIDDESSTWRLASGGEDGKVRVWNLKTRKSVAALDSHVSVVRRLDYSPEENALLSCSRDKTVMLWDCKTWKIRMTLPTYEEVETAGFLSGCSAIYTGGEHGILKLWELDTGRQLTNGQPARSEIEAIQFSLNIPSLPFLLTALADQSVVLYDIAAFVRPSKGSRSDELPVARRINGNLGQIVDIAFVGSDKSRMALATNSEDIKIINLQTNSTDDGSLSLNSEYFGSEVGLLKGHTDIVISMDVDASGTWLATGSKDNTARLWSMHSETGLWSEYGVFSGHAESVSAVCLVSKAHSDATAAESGQAASMPSFLLTGAQDKTIKKWEVGKVGNTGKPRALFTRKAHDKDINAIAIHPNLTLFASASQDKAVKIWSVEDGTTIGVLRGHRRGVWSVAFSPANTQVHIAGAPSTSASRGFVLTGSGDKTVRIWSMMDYSCLLTMEGHSNSVLKVLWLPQQNEDQKSSHDKRGQLVASAGSDTLIKLWDTSTGECAATLDNHTDRVWALAVKPSPAHGPAEENDISLVSGAGDGSMTFWRDTTAASADEARARQTAAVETDQRLDNLVYSKNYREAIVLALQLDQPARLLSLFRSVTEAADFGTADTISQSYIGSVEVDDAIASLADDQLYRLLLRCRDWSASARTALIAQRVLRTVVDKIDMIRLSELKPPRSSGFKNGAVPLHEILRGLRAYSERHYSRVSDMWDESFMVEFTLREMDALLLEDVAAPASAQLNDTRHVNGHVQNDEDVMSE